MLKKTIMQYSPENITRILVVRIGAIGDFVHTLPVIYALRKKYSKAHIEIMGYLSIAELAKGKAYADATCSFDRNDMAHFFRKYHDGSTSEELPPSLLEYFGRFDLIMSFLNGKDNAFIENLRKIKGPQIICHNSFPSENENVHIIDHLIKSLGPLGIDNIDRLPKIFVNDNDMDYARLFFEKNNVNDGNMLAAVHPGSGSKKKCWPIDKFAEIVQWLKLEFSANILIISGPADKDNVNSLLNTVHRYNPVVVEDLPLMKLTSILENCDLFVGNDSGVTHISAAVQTPTVAIFGPTDLNTWKPLGKSTRTAKSNVHCSPCTRYQRNQCERQICLEDITVEDVISEINSLNLKWKTSRSISGLQNNVIETLRCV